MATSSKHDHKNVGCHRISLQLRSGDPVLATIRTPAEIDKSPQRKAPARLGRVARVSERVPVQALASRRPPISEPAPRPTSRRRLGSERPRILQAHSPAGLQAAGLLARGLRATSLRARSLQTSDRPAPSRTSRRKPRQVSATNHVPPTSDFRTGSRCALVFPGFPSYRSYHTPKQR
jgi:hypothetical protein